MQSVISNCWPASLSFRECCLSSAPPAACFQNGADSGWCCYYGATRGDPGVVQWLARSACSSRTLHSLPEHQKELQDLARMLQPQGEDRTQRWFSSSLRFKTALVNTLSARSAHQHTALELGIGSSATTVLLSALFCKVIVVDLSKPLLQRSAVQGLPNVVHLQLDLRQESWRAFASSERFDFVLIDAVHTYAAVTQDIAAALDVLQYSRRPMIAFHDYNIPGVKFAYELYRNMGAFRSCEAIGELFTEEEVEDEIEINQDLQFPSNVKYPGPFYEGMLCEVDTRSAALITQDIRVPSGSVSHMRQVWQIYNRLEVAFPIGTMQFFPGATDLDGTFLLRETFGNKLPWFGTWTSNRSQMHIEIDTYRGSQVGTLRFSMDARMSFMGIISRPTPSNSSRFRTKHHGRSCNISNVEAYGGQAARYKSGSLEIYRGAFPEYKFYGVAAPVVFRELIEFLSHGVGWR